MPSQTDSDGTTAPSDEIPAEPAIHTFNSYALAFSHGLDRNTPRLRRRLVSLAKKPSTALSQDAEVGVKWNVQRGCRASHFCTLGCLWVA